MAINAYFCEKKLFAIIATSSYFDLFLFYQLRLNALVVNRSE